MRALRLHGVGDLRLDSVAPPQPEKASVLVAVEATGVCGSDLHFIDGTATTSYLPLTLGHEVAGTVVSAEEGWATGARVVVVVGAHCGRCPRCIEGRTNLCQNGSVVGIHRDGGLADFIAVPADQLVAIPDTLEAGAAATAVDAGATAWHAVHRRANVSAGSSVAIIGIGGLGSYGLQIARQLTTGPIVAVDTDQMALDLAISLGADHTVLVEAGMSIGSAVKRHVPGGVDSAIEFVGRAATVDAAVKSLRPGGRAVAVGVGIEPLVTIPPVLWSNNEYTLAGAYGSLPGDTEAVLAELAAGRLQPPPVTLVTLDEAATAITDLATAGHGYGRLIVTP